MPAAQPEREQRLSQLYNCTSCSGAVRSMHARGPRAVTTYKEINQAPWYIIEQRVKTVTELEIYSVIAPRTIGAAAPLGKVNTAVCQPSLGGPLDRAWRQERS